LLADAFGRRFIFFQVDLAAAGGTMFNFDPSPVWLITVSKRPRAVARADLPGTTSVP
jgi:hypothetical protein